ncbi:unnamed protein product [Peniophora sp. CBMAI 1063]|nr:unnamed protein product [Peniophora sp. CBMAI 1063]
MSSPSYTPPPSAAPSSPTPSSPAPSSPTPSSPAPSSPAPSSPAPSSPTSPLKVPSSPADSVTDFDLSSAPPKTPTKATTDAPTPEGPKRTPAVRLRQSVATSLVGRILNEHINNENTKDMEGKWLGPIPTDQWKRDLGPQSKTTPPTKTIPFHTVATTTNGEASFVEAINSSGIFEGFQLWCSDTHAVYGRDETTDRERSFHLSPDVAIFGRDDIRLDAGDEERLERMLGEMAVVGDLKSSNQQDPCLALTTPEDRRLLGILESLTDTELSRLVRGQLLTYARAICANSHRTHLYGFIILPRYARLLYFDRSAVVYSELFDWRETSVLAEFFQQFAVAGPLARGYDPSVQKISADDKLVRDAGTIFNKAYDAGDELPDDITWDSVFKSVRSADTTYWLCNVYDEKTRTFHRVLTYRVHTSTPYFAGRATCGYVGVDIDRKSVAYMKRSWRIGLPSFPKERDIYLSFEESEGGGPVPHLPGCYFGGDVPRNSDSLAKDYFDWVEAGKPGGSWTPPSDIEPICTVTPDYADAHNIRRGASDRTDLTDAQIEVIPYVLTVTLFSRIGGRLRDFKSTRQLCTAVRDALETHDVAYRLKKILHRDVSESNILIAKIKGKKGEVEGLLIDWDLCVELWKYLTARRKGRTGTWAFMSARMLEKNQSFVHEAVDDLESFCYVLHWEVFHYRHTVPFNRKSILLQQMRQAFSPSESVLDAEAGANAKKNFLTGQIEVFELATKTTTPVGLRNIMRGIRYPFGMIYTHPPVKPEYPATLDPDVEIDYQRDLEIHERKSAKGMTMCTHTHMLKAFNDALADADLWTGDGCAKDMYPPVVCKAYDQGKDLADFYETDDVTGSVNALRRSQANIILKRSADDAGLLVRAPRAYTPGSGRSRTEITAAIRSSGTTATNSSGTTAASATVAGEAGDSSESSAEGSRKRQRVG